MSGLRTEELLIHARRAVKEVGRMPELVPLLETSIEATRQKLDRFVKESENDAEMPPPIREELKSALEGYLSSQKAMHRAASERDSHALAAALKEAENQVQAVRSIQLSHRGMIAQGPTVFPYLNRVLIQYGAVREGGDPARLVQLLHSSSNFCRWLRNEATSGAVSAVDTQEVYHLQQLLDALAASLKADQELPDIHDDVVELTTRLAELVGDREEPDEGPTSVPAVNQVFKALASCTGAPEEVDFLVAVVEQCREAVRTLVPPSAGGEMMEAVNAVLNSLDTLERCMVEQIGYEELLAAAGDLESSTVRLSTLLAARGEDPEFAALTEGLSALFKSVLQPAYAFLNGEGDPDTVRAACDHLELSASRIQREAGRVEGEEKRLQAIQEALELMGEAAETLRAVASTGNAGLFQVATALCFQATNRLKEAGVG